MDTANPMSDMSMPPDPSGLRDRLAQRAAAAAESAAVSGDEAQKVRIAKDFESILLTRLFEQMKESVGQWSGESDAGSEQIQGLFWMGMADALGQKGGLGLWKQIYQFMNDADPISGTKMDASL